jgi:hypothetical protein
LFSVDELKAGTLGRFKLGVPLYLTANGHELTRIKGFHSRSLASIRGLLSSLALAEAFQTSLNPVLVLT